MSSGSAYRQLLGRLESVRSLGVDLGLQRVRAVLEKLGAPDSRFVSLQIAGTNGKGSTAAMTEAILRAAGLRTGLFTSPHLHRFTERIRIDGKEVDGDQLACWDERIAATAVPLTYFEVATVLALVAFAEAGVAVAVLETGLGGRLDSVTATSPIATAITGIDFDHMELLGSSLTEIAREKAGIARRGVPLLLGPLPAEAEAEIRRVAGLAGAPLSWPVLAERFGVPALPGEHQRHNAALAVALARLAATRLGRTLSDDQIREGLAGVKWPARLEWVAPDVLIDAAHNPQGARALVAATALAERPQRALVLSVVRGKQVDEMLQILLPHFQRVIFTQSRSERSLPAPELATRHEGCGEWPAAGLRTVEPDPVQALAEARRWASQQTRTEGSLPAVVVVAGSLFLAGQLRGHLLGEREDPIVSADPLP